ncbi:MAG: hypothetical protein ACREFT_03025, partial [Acetobacteraceae bacterium]
VEHHISYRPFPLGHRVCAGLGLQCGDRLRYPRVLMGSLGDRVTVSRTELQGMIISDITGSSGKLPLDSRENTAGRALLVEISGDGASVIESG